MILFYQRSDAPTFNPLYTHLPQETIDSLYKHVEPGTGRRYNLADIAGPGGGWISSPAGAYAADPTLAGKATFGFVSRYQKGASLPSGNTEFQFQTAGLTFHATSFDWLIVNKAGLNAQFKGWGTINGTGSYGFMIWATDGSPDTFRIAITDGNGGVVYDNHVAQAIGGGSIVVRTN